MFILSGLSNILFYAMAVHIFLGYYDPILYNSILINIAQVCIQAYSKSQIISYKMYDNLKKNPKTVKYIEYIENTYENITKDPTIGMVEVIAFGYPVIYSKDKLKQDIDMIPEFEFIIYSDRKEKSGPVDKILFFGKPDNYEYEKCNYKFMSLTIVISDNEKYDLKLHSEKENYYITKNILNKNIFSFLIRKQYGIIKDEYTLCYRLEIIDQNINIINLTEKDSIVFGLDNYSIMHLDSDKNSSSTESLDDSAAESKNENSVLTNEYIEVGRD